MNKSSLTAALALLCVFAPEVAVADAPSLRVAGFTHAGSGCPDGTVHVSVGAGAGSALMRFDELAADARGGAMDRTCQVALKLHIDPTWSFAIPAVHYQGTAALGDGAVATETSTYSFAGSPALEDARGQTTLSGPFSGDYARSDDTSALLWSPCGVSDPTLVIQTDLHVEGAEAQIRVESVQGKVIHAVDLLWKKCP